MREVRPSLIYKYKSVSNEAELSRLEETLVRKTLYFPTLKYLNDPMEACSVQFGLQIAGSGYHSQAGMVHPVITNIQERFGIISFTAVPNSPIMWAHYGKEYKGCCLIFSTNGIFSSIEPTIYSDITFGYNAEALSEETVERLVRESLLYKDTDWAYENEWRYIDIRESDKVTFEQKDLKGVIVGERMDHIIQNQIASICREEGIPCFRTYVMNAKKAIGVVPVEYDHHFIVRSEIDEYMQQKKDEKMCLGEESELFYVLNSGIDWMV